MPLFIVLMLSKVSLIVIVLNKLVILSTVQIQHQMVSGSFGELKLCPRTKIIEQKMNYYRELSEWLIQFQRKNLENVTIVGLIEWKSVVELEKENVLRS